jgi:nucleoside-diphosphate-sugar epimerase
VTDKQPLIMTGAQGRIGRLIRAFAHSPEFGHFSMVCTARQPASGVSGWDMMHGPVPLLPEGGVLLHLAGAVPGRGKSAGMAENLVHARAILAVDRAHPFAHVVFLSSVAVYGPAPGILGESAPPLPQSDYGRSKLDAERLLAKALGSRLTILRLANLAGADALLGAPPGTGAQILDPVPGQPSGPERSYIGPATFAKALGDLLTKQATGADLPPILNVAQPGAVAMADLLQVSGRSWRFGPERAGIIPRVEVDVTKLCRILPLPRAAPADLVAELRQLAGIWR